MVRLRNKINEALKSKSNSNPIQVLQSFLPSTIDLNQSLGAIREAVTRGFDPSVPENERLAARRGNEAINDAMTHLTTARSNARNQEDNAQQKIRVAQRRLEESHLQRANGDVEKAIDLYLEDNPPSRFHQFRGQEGRELARQRVVGNHQNHQALLQEGQQELEQTRQAQQQLQQAIPKVQDMFRQTKREAISTAGGNPNAKEITDDEAAELAGTAEEPQQPGIGPSTASEDFDTRSTGQRLPAGAGSDASGIGPSTAPEDRDATTRTPGAGGPPAGRGGFFTDPNAITVPPGSTPGGGGEPGPSGQDGGGLEPGRVVFDPLLGIPVTVANVDGDQVTITWNGGEGRAVRDVSALRLDIPEPTQEGPDTPPPSDGGGDGRGDFGIDPSILARLGGSEPSEEELELLREQAETQRFERAFARQQLDQQRQLENANLTLQRELAENQNTLARFDSLVSQNIARGDLQEAARARRSRNQLQLRNQEIERQGQVLGTLGQIISQPLTLPGFRAAGGISGLTEAFGVSGGIPGFQAQSTSIPDRVSAPELPGFTGLRATRQPHPDDEELAAQFNMSPEEWRALTDAQRRSLIANQDRSVDSPRSRPSQRGEQSGTQSDAARRRGTGGSDDFSGQLGSLQQGDDNIQTSLRLQGQDGIDPIDSSTGFLEDVFRRTEPLARLSRSSPRTRFSRLG